MLVPRIAWKVPEARQQRLLGGVEICPSGLRRSEGTWGEPWLWTSVRTSARWLPEPRLQHGDPRLTLGVSGRAERGKQTALAWQGSRPRPRRRRPQDAHGVGGQWWAGGPPGTPASPLSGRYPNFMDVGAAVGDTAGLRSHGVGPGTSGLPRVYYGSEV